MTTAFVYDDLPSVPTELRPLIGAPKFGDIVFRRRSLYERIGDMVRPFEWSVFRLSAAAGPEALATELAHRGCTRVLQLSSELVPADERLALDRLERLAAANDACQGALEGAPAPLVALPFEAWAGAAPSLGRSRLDASVSVPVDGAFVDVSDVVSLLDFLSGAFNSRHFNSIERSRRQVTKHSTDVAKVRAEHDFYHVLPERMRRWFVMPYDLRETEAGASYTMERLLMLDMGQQWVNGAVDLQFLGRFLEDAFRFLDERERRDCDRDTARRNFDALYVDKVRARLGALEGSELAAYLDDMLRTGTSFDSLADLAECYFGLLAPYADDLPDHECVGHGDFCFSNILYDKRIRLLKLIDPKGASSLEEAYADPWYDYAKLSHSVLGGYDFVVNDLYDVVVDTDLALRLCSPDAVFRPFSAAFVAALEARRIDVRRVRLYEASLFLSMLPLHRDRPRDVLAFVLIAAHILDEIRGQ